MNQMKTNISKQLGAVTAVMLLAMTTQAQTPFYSVNGTGGTGGATAGVTVTPSTAPSGSSTLTDLGATANIEFWHRCGDGVAGESIVNAATGQGGNQVLAGTLGASTSYSDFTLTMWVNLASGANNYRLLEIASGSPATTGSADGTTLFFGAKQRRYAVFSFMLIMSMAIPVGTSIAASSAGILVEHLGLSHSIAGILSQSPMMLLRVPRCIPET